MFNFIAIILGKLMRFIYDILSANFTEPGSVSFYALSIIIMTLLVSLMTIPITISSQNKQKKQEDSSQKWTKSKKNTAMTNKFCKKRCKNSTKKKA